jgi:hypothetical protein
MVILHKSGYHNYQSVFVFILSSMHLFAFYYTDKKQLTYNKIPYLIAALIITCSFLPLIFRENPVIIFLSPLSVFLILFSKYSRNQSSVRFSLVAMLIMAVIYLYQWIFDFIPELYSPDGIVTKGIFYQGLISSFFILMALSINNVYLKKLAISFTPKLLKKLNYLKILKGFFLFVIYLSGYWVFNYLTQVIYKAEPVNLLTWFTFNCLYFIFYIPHLAWQRSSYFRIIIIVALISSLACFTIIHLYVLQIRDHYLETEGATIIPFLLHYIPLAFLLGMLFTLLRYFKRAFPGKKTLIKGFWIYFYITCTFLLLSEFDHLIVLYRYHNGFMIDTTIFITQKLPYSILLILSSITLITIGFKVKSRFLRIFALFILGIVLIKILAYDVISLNPQSKIILFFILGVSLLGISVSYPRIKRSFFQKDSPESNENFSGKRKRRV